MKREAITLWLLGNSKSNCMSFAMKSLAFLHLCHLLSEQKVYAGQITSYDLVVPHSGRFRNVELSTQQIFFTNLVLEDSSTQPSFMGIRLIDHNRVYFKAVCISKSPSSACLYELSFPYMYFVRLTNKMQLIENC